MKKLLGIIIAIIIVVLVGVVGGYFYFTSSPSKNAESVNIYVSEGETYSTIGSLLKSNGLIRNELVYKIYIKLNPPKDLEYGDYVLSTGSNLKDLIATLEKGSVNLSETKSLTFVEGKNMRYFIEKVTKEFNITEEEILNKLSSEEYLDELINRYWFLTEDIKNSNIYYSLEGYLYPDTYEFYTNTSIGNIFETMLNNTEKKLSPYKSEVENNKYTIHEMITLASIIELEAGNATDRKGVAGVFYNRLNDGWSLGSDVTTYYASKVELWSRDLKKSELNECNSYNTRASCMAGKLPVGPICNPSIDSLVAAIEPTSHNYYYFVADKNGKTYFNTSESGHTKTVNELKNSGLWYEYE